MHYHWQDIVIAVGILGFNIALIPSLFSKQKPLVSTSIMTMAFQLAILTAYVSLSLWYSAAMGLINALFWGTLAVQKLRQPAPAKRKK